MTARRDRLVDALRHPCAVGYTLIELMVVLVIIALILGVVAVNLKASFRAGRLEDAVGALELLDQQTRSHARRHRKSARFEFGRSSVKVTRETRATSSTVNLANGIHIDRFRASSRQADGSEKIVDISIQGQSPTYAVRLRTNSGHATWLLFAGVTGHCLQTDNEREIQEIFTRLAAAGTDTD